MREHYGTFPGAVQVEAEFGDFANLSVNGDLITATGFLFRVRNTSYGDGAASAFANEPDSDFSEGGQLTDAAIAAISAAQPFGLYAFTVVLPDGSGRQISAPAGFELRRELSGGGDGRYANPGASPRGRARGHSDEDDDAEESIEFSFRLDLADASGLLFDENAPPPSTTFGAPRTGFLEFFVSTAAHALGRDGDDDEDDEASQPAFSTGFAWAEDGRIRTRFDADDDELDDNRLRPSGDLAAAVVPAPEPRSAALVALGLALLARLARTRLVATRPLRRS